jgi:hypothetical protein
VEFLHTTEVSVDLNVYIYRGSIWFFILGVETFHKLHENSHTKGSISNNRKEEIGTGKVLVEYFWFLSELKL